jgi:hypothetical protein
MSDCESYISLGSTDTYSTECSSPSSSLLDFIDNNILQSVSDEEPDQEDLVLNTDNTFDVTTLNILEHPRRPVAIINVLGEFLSDSELDDADLSDSTYSPSSQTSSLTSSTISTKSNSPVLL